MHEAWLRLSRPIIALLIKNGVMYQQFARWSKESYVSVAEADFGKRARPTNQSRIALLTGLDRKEVKRVRDALHNLSEEQSSRPSSDRLSRVLSGWYQDPAYSQDGQPQPLVVEEGFAALYKTYGGDVPASTILKELEQGGAVARLADGRVVAIKRYYMPAGSDPEAVIRSAEVYRDLGETLLHNLYRSDDTPSRFEGRASHPRISKQHAAEFQAFVETRGQAFLEEIDQWLYEKNLQTDDDDKTLRLGVGLYAIHNENNDET